MKKIEILGYGLTEMQSARGASQGGGQGIRY